MLEQNHQSSAIMVPQPATWNLKKTDHPRETFCSIGLKYIIMSTTHRFPKHDTFTDYPLSSKEGNSKGGENDGRLLIGFYYSAVTGNRKQVLTGSSESCEHKCRWNTLSFKLQVLFES